MISILIPTFNQEHFIEDAIKSAINQTYENKEILIGDDCSTDATVNIIKKYSSQYENINLYEWKKNEGGLKNIDKLLQVARGEYVVILEGDDFWLDSNYISKAIKFLRQNKDLAFVSCRYIRGSLKSQSSSKFYGYVNSYALSLGNFLQLGSVVFFKKFAPRIEPSFINLPLGDYPIFMRLLESGNGYVFKDKSFFYRVHDGGVWSLKNRIYQIENTILTINAMMNKYKSNYFFPHQLNYLELNKIIRQNDKFYLNISILWLIISNVHTLLFIYLMKKIYLLLKFRLWRKNGL